MGTMAKAEGKPDTHVYQRFLGEVIGACKEYGRIL
jgi:hypothetical protein